jgi:tetratricopeptide (TPR) repeat protein
MDVTGVTGLAHKLVGRARELELLTGLMTRAAAGHGGAVLVEGEPGIGKSALARAALAGGPAGCQVFWGTCDELDQQLPFQPLIAALHLREPSEDPRRAAIARILCGEAPADPGAAGPAALGEQLLALIVDHCAARPAVLVIDDVQWADPASVQLLGRLARLAGQVPLLLVAIMRPVPHRDDLVKLRRAQNDAVHIRLAPLPGPAVAELVAGLVGGPPDDELLVIAQDAAGNPLYLTELVAALRRGPGIDVTADGLATLAADPLLAGAVPRSLAAAIANRLDFLSASARETLRAAALLGVEFEVTDLAVVMDRDLLDLVGVVHEARSAGVLVDWGARLRFRHPLIHRTLYESMARPTLISAHEQAGRALARAGAAADRVARQLLRAADGPPEGEAGTVPPLPEWALTWLADAARLLVSQAPQVAAQLLRLAVASVPEDSAEHVRLANWLAEALYSRGDRDAAERVAVRALSQASDQDLRLDLLCTLVKCRMLAGRSADFLSTLREVLASPGLPVRHRGRLLVLAARTHCNDGELDVAAQVAAQALAAGEEAADSWAVGWALSAAGSAMMGRGRYMESIALYDRALAVAHGDPVLIDLRLLLLLNKAVALISIDRHVAALTLGSQVHRLADQVGSSFRGSQAHSLLGQILFETGQWDDAIGEVLNGPADLNEPAAVCCDLGIAAMICFHRGDRAAALRHLTAAVPHAARIGNRLVPPLVLARSLAHETAGELAEALAEFVPWLNGGTEESAQAEDLLADAARLAKRMGNENLAQNLAKLASELAASSEIPRRLATALYCSGLADGDPSRLLTAADRYGSAGRPLSQARALEAAAWEFAHVGERDRSQAALASAQQIYTRLGAAAASELTGRYRAARTHGRSRPGR